MATQYRKRLTYTCALLVAGVLLLAGTPAMAWSYGHYGGHNYGGYGRHYGHHYRGHYNYYPGYSRHRYYGGYRNYRNNDYSSTDDANSASDEYSSIGTSSNTAAVDSNYGWGLLASGEQDSALDIFSTQAVNNPENGTYKIGYSLAAAGTGDHKRGVWAMRRAASIDPDALHYLTLDNDMRDIVNKLVHDYEDGSDHGLGATDRDFIIASLYYLLHDAEAADRTLPDQDMQTSTENLGHLIQQMQADDHQVADNLSR